MLHLIKVILGITNELNLAFQRKKGSRYCECSVISRYNQKRLQGMRYQGWEGMFTMVNDLCLAHDIQLPNMNAMYIPLGSISKHKAQTNGISNMTYYQRVMYDV